MDRPNGFGFGTAPVTTEARIHGTIGVPVRESMPTAFVQSFFLLNRPDPTYTILLQGSSYAAQRNTIAATFEGDWLCFIDSDMMFSSDTLTRLLAHGDLDIVSGTYCRRSPPYDYMIWDTDERPIKAPLPKAVFEVGLTGAAFTIIRRRVFEAMSQPWFEHGKFGNPHAPDEDVYFCRKARQLGFRVWTDPTVQVWHLYGGAVAPGPEGYPVHKHGSVKWLDQSRQEEVPV